MNVSKKILILAAALLVVSTAFATFTVSKYIYDTDKDSYITLDMAKCQQLATAVNLTYQTVNSNTCKVWGVDYALALIYLKHPELVNITDPDPPPVNSTCNPACSTGFVCIGSSCLNENSVYVRPGIMILRDNISVGQTKTISGSFEVINTYTSSSATINLSGTGSLAGRTTFSESSFTLSPGQTKTVNFYVSVSSSLLTYNGDILVLYNVNGVSSGISMSTTILLTQLACKSSGTSCSAGAECCSGTCAGQTQSTMLYPPAVTSSVSFTCPATGYTVCKLYQTKTTGDLKPMTPLLIGTCNPGKKCPNPGMYAEYTGYGEFGANVCS